MESAMDLLVNRSKTATFLSAHAVLYAYKIFIPHDIN